MIETGIGWRATLRRLLTWTLPVLAVAPVLRAQGPNVEYYYDPAVALPWAECSVGLAGGSRLSLPFLPMVTRGIHAPVGTADYTTDVAVEAAMVFVGDGIVNDDWDAYRHAWSGYGEPIDVAGKAVVLCYDCPGSAGDVASSSPAARVAVAAKRGAVAVVIFSVEKEAPFLLLDRDRVPDPEIPVVSLSRRGAAALLAAAGVGDSKLLDRLAAGEAPPPSQELITRLRLTFDGAFERVETDHFVFAFRGSEIPRSEVAAAAEVHEASMSAIETILGSPGDRPLPRGTIVYFTGFDTKTFYTHHWGSGLATDGGVFLIWAGADLDPGLIAHENTHTFTGYAWGESSSFLAEGVARHVEAAVTDPGMNHEETRRRLAQGEVPPLDAMLPIDVGSDALTPVAYPAAGSFVGYLIDAYGLDALREVYRLEGRSAEEKAAVDTWTTALGKALPVVDREWREWLRQGEAHPHRGACAHRSGPGPSRVSHSRRKRSMAAGSGGCSSAPQG